MIFNTKDVIGKPLHASDGRIGHVVDLYFDDRQWALRYLVVDTGNWLPGKLVLIAPVSVGSLDVTAEEVVVDLTRDAIKHAPGIDSDEPVSRQYEQELASYYQWPVYWNAGGSYVPVTHDVVEAAVEDTEKHDSHLRSFDEVKGYHIHTHDGSIGHVIDMLFDNENWTLKYFVVDTGSWLPDKKVLVSPLWIEKVSFKSGELYVDLDREIIKESLPFENRSMVTEKYERTLFDHYNKIDMWPGV